MFSEVVSPEILFGIGIVVLLAILAYASLRAGRLSRSEAARTDAATRAMQRNEEAREQAMHHSR
jgi:hypothetical protein